MPTDNEDLYQPKLAFTVVDQLKSYHGQWLCVKDIAALLSEGRNLKDNQIKSLEYRLRYTLFHLVRMGRISAEERRPKNQFVIAKFYKINES